MPKHRARKPRPEEVSRAAQVVDRLDASMPGAKIELDFTTDLELLVAVILSAQCTDKRVNLVTPALFAKYRAAADYARAAPEELHPLIQTCGLYRNKAKNIVAAMRAIAHEHGGRVPREREALEALPGVGRKTAGVVLVHLGAGQAFPVDTHVGRLARRLGFSRQRSRKASPSGGRSANARSTRIDPDKVEQDLERLFPEARWGKAHQLFVWHGRRTCFARAPACERCVVRTLCPKRGVKKTEAGNRPVPWA